jgi:hypothetical protein
LLRKKLTNIIKISYPDMYKEYIENLLLKWKQNG